MTDGVEGTPTDALRGRRRRRSRSIAGVGIAEAILRRLGAVAAGHGLDLLVAPVRPTWKERYPLVPIERYAAWRRGDGLPYDPWLRTHERLGGEMLASAPRSMTISGTRAEWEEWTGMMFPDDGDYVVPGALVPVHFKNEPRRVRRTQRLGPARVLAALLLLLERAAHLAVRRLGSGTAPCCSCISSSAARSCS